MEENSYKFFQNNSCEYYPCHNGIKNINCMFCFCPLYKMEDCPGNYNYLLINGNKVKDCSSCLFPHEPDNYNKIMQILYSNINEKGK